MTVDGPRHELDDELLAHSKRGYFFKRNFVAALLLFFWVTTLAGIYRVDLWLLTPIMLGAIAAWALLRSQYGRFADIDHYFLAVAVIDNLMITALVYVMGGAGSAAVFTAYTYPLTYHALTRRRSTTYIVANMAAVMYSGMAALECAGVLPYRDVFGFGKPPPMTYLGLSLGAFLMLNLTATVGVRVKAAYERNQRKVRQLTAETEFISAAISHELKNPLSAAVNAADLLAAEADGASAEDTRDLVSLVRDNVAKAYDMLTRLRDLLISVNKEEAAADVRLGEVVTEVVEDLAASGTVRDATIEVAPQLPSVRGQRTTLVQVFRNLVVNALEHGRDSGPPTVRLQYLGKDSVPGFLRFAVCDDGPGISREHRERVFEPFVALGDGLGTGRGLGLALVKRVVEDGGGRIWVEDGERGGTRFVFTLPRGGG